MDNRATVRIVPGEGDGMAPSPAAGTQHTAPMPQEGASQAPEAQPSAFAPPPVDDSPPTIGGNPLEPITPEQIVQASGGSIADQMRARFESIAATEEFPVPGWELPSGDPGLIVVARTFGDKGAYAKGITNEAFIARSTHQLVFVDDHGNRQIIEGGWGPGLAQIMGVQVTKATELINLVISKPNPSDPTQRIPNVAGIAQLSAAIIDWAGRGVASLEEGLGE